MLNLISTPEIVLLQDDQSGSNDRKFEKSSSPASDAGSSKARSSHASNSGSESPKPARKRFGSMADDLDVSRFNGESSGGASGGGSGASSEQLEAMKQEILREMRKEMAKMKQEIIEGDWKKEILKLKEILTPVIFNFQQ